MLTKENEEKGDIKRKGGNGGKWRMNGKIKKKKEYKEKRKRKV